MTYLIEGNMAYYCNQCGTQHTTTACPIQAPRQFTGTVESVDPLKIRLLNTCADFLAKENDELKAKIDSLLTQAFKDNEAVLGAGILAKRCADLELQVSQYHAALEEIVNTTATSTTAWKIADRTINPTDKPKEEAK